MKTTYWQRVIWCAKIGGWKKFGKEYSRILWDLYAAMFDAIENLLVGLVSCIRLFSAPFVIGIIHPLYYAHWKANAINKYIEKQESAKPNENKEG